MSFPQLVDIDELEVGDFVQYYHREQAQHNPGTLCIVLKTETNSGVILMNPNYLGGCWKAFEEEVFKLTHMQRAIVEAWALAMRKATKEYRTEERIP